MRQAAANNSLLRREGALAAAPSEKDGRQIASQCVQIDARQAYGKGTASAGKPDGKKGLPYVFFNEIDNYGKDGKQITASTATYS